MMGSSLLPELGPMAASALAFGLAYLKLRRFRYRESIQRRAQEALALLDKKDSTLAESFFDTEYYIRLKILASWSESKQIRKGLEAYPEFPVAIHIYYLLYESRLGLGSGLDRITSWICTVASGLIFIIGRAHAVNIFDWEWVLGLGQQDWISLWWSLLAICLILPISLTILGDWIEANIHNFIARTEKEFGKFITRPIRDLNRT